MVETDKNNFLLLVKSKHILNKIMNNLQINNQLNIIRYNNNLQKRLNKTINDYKNEYFQIEIEVIPQKDQYFSFFFLLDKNHIITYI